MHLTREVQNSPSNQKRSNEKSNHPVPRRPGISFRLRRHSHHEHDNHFAANHGARSRYNHHYGDDQDALRLGFWTRRGAGFEFWRHACGQVFGHGANFADAQKSSERRVVTEFPNLLSPVQRPPHFTSGQAARGAQSCPAHESCDVLPLLLASPPLLVRVDHADAHAHEVRDPHAPV